MNRGFTLVELLGVLAILAILAVITVPLIQSLIEGGLDDSQQIQEESFEQAAESWAASEVFALPSPGKENSIEVCLDVLIEEGFLETNSDGSITVGNSDKEYNLAKSCVTITNEGTSTQAEYKYEFEPVYNN